MEKIGSKNDVLFTCTSYDCDANEDKNTKFRA